MSKEDILYYSRQDQIGSLDPGLEDLLDKLIEQQIYPDLNNIQDTGYKIQQELQNYKKQFNIGTAVVGMSGGVDSALTAALFKSAGWNVIGVTMPIHQRQEETDRGIEVSKLLGLEHLHVDLTSQYETLLEQVRTYDNNIDHSHSAIRRGNLRVRSRMITLYNIASMRNGLVASTDNFSELAAGFWTLHGDVGDLAPIQCLSKSWEVPRLADSMGIPLSTVRATPTDGLGISNGDEDQFGFSYLEFDIVLLTLCHSGWVYRNQSEISEFLSSKNVDGDKVNKILSRIRNSVFKRNNPCNLNHPLFPGRLQGLKNLDKSILIK